MIDLFNIIAEEYSFSNIQKIQYAEYVNFLQSENKKYNLTRIDSEEKILYYHLKDTLQVTQCGLLEEAESIADVGSGCGVPGILLAIYYPHKKFYLIEVVRKKINFLKQCIELLGLSNCVVIEEDFLTCVCRHLYKIDFFIGRASLGLGEFIKIYKIPCYRKSKIIYWGSSLWKDDAKHNIILKQKDITVKEYPYEIKENEIVRKLNYIFIQKT